MSSKEKEAKTTSERVAPETLPAYEEEVGQRSQPPADPPSQPASKAGKAAGPTQDSPFNFPSDAPPTYSAASSSSSSQKPIAIPQTHPDPAAPFIDAYSPVLLHHGITPETWRSFLVTLSAFLTAKVSDRAISHAGDVAKQIGERPKSFFKGVTSHIKHVGKHVGNNAKKGNIIGAAMGVVGGAITIPITAATGAVSTIVQLPGSTVMAVAKKPQTPRERAVAYAAVANRDWFEPRGLLARLLDTEELCQALGVPSSVLLESGKGRETDAKERLGRLNDRIASLEIMELDALELGSKTLWLVLMQAGGETL